MDESLLNQVTERVLQQLKHNRRALLIGAAPNTDCGYTLVNQAPYEAVMIGSLSAAELLRPPDCILTALLEGIPVFLCLEALPHHRYKNTAPRLLLQQLQRAEQTLLQWGARPTQSSEPSGLITAGKAQELIARGQLPAAGARLTPLARDILEGKLP